MPNFLFADTPDPIALAQTTAQLSRHFQRQSQTAYAFSNGLMSQVAAMRPTARPAPAAGGGDLGPQIAGAGGNEDLFIFRREGVTLARGERMVVPIAEFKLAYRDVYTLEIPLLPPPEVRRSFNSSRRRELAKLMNAPKAIHKIRLVNKSPYPLTTAPALILKSGRLLAQSMMTYTAIGATTDLEITTAVNLHVAHVERETGRKPQALKWFRNGSNWQWLTRIDMAGVIQLANHSGKPVELEVKRRVLGNVEKASNEGAATRADTLGGRAYVRPADYPHWWNWYSWPRWWHQHNGFDTISWTVKIDPKKRLELKYNWHYFWG